MELNNRFPFFYIPGRNIQVLPEIFENCQKHKETPAWWNWIINFCWSLIFGMLWSQNINLCSTWQRVWHFSKTAPRISKLMTCYVNIISIHPNLKLNLNPMVGTLWSLPHDARSSSNLWSHTPLTRHCKSQIPSTEQFILKDPNRAIAKALDSKTLSFCQFKSFPSPTCILAGR